MHRIDSDGTVNALPTPDAVGGTVGYFQKGDPVAGQKATVVTADWANATQEEICNVIEGAGLVLDKTSNDQLYLAIQAIVSGINKYKHTQGVANTTWTITHNLGSKDHMIQLFDATDVLIDADSVTRNTNTTTVVFTNAQAGSALLIKIA